MCHGHLTISSDGYLLSHAVPRPVSQTSLQLCQVQPTLHLPQQVLHLIHCPFSPSYFFTHIQIPPFLYPITLLLLHITLCLLPFSSSPSPLFFSSTFPPFRSFMLQLIEAEKKLYPNQSQPSILPSEVGKIGGLVSEYIIKIQFSPLCTLHISSL